MNLTKAALLLVASLVANLPGASARGDFDALIDSVTTHTLDNGWTFLIVPRTAAPVVSFHTYIDVGAIHEDDGATGMAHMFEHMAFKGSDRLGSLNWKKEERALKRLEVAYLRYSEALANGDKSTAESALVQFEKSRELASKQVDPEAFSRILEEAGGAATLNASTSAEATRYVVSLPSNQIEKWCWLERERFDRLVLREFYKERDAVLEERRMRVESSPFGALLESLFGTAYQTHPYRRPVIGYEADLNRYTRTEAQAFYDKHYGVRRFVTAIVGDVDPETLVPMLERYFGDMPAGPEPTTVDVVEAPQTEERRVEVPFPSMPIMMAAWHVPAVSAPDYPALELGIYIMSQAETSLLTTKLVRESRQAAEVGGIIGLPGNSKPSLALIYAIPGEGTSSADLETAIFAAIDEFVKVGPTATELAAAQTYARADLIRQLASNADCAANLCEWQSKAGDWKQLFKRTDAYKDITAAQIQAALTKYLVKSNRTVATIVAPQAK